MLITHPAPTAPILGTLPRPRQTSTQDANVNADLTALGSSIRLTSDSIDQGVNTVGPAHIFTNSLTTGVSSFEFACTTKVTGGTTLLTNASGNHFIATQNFTSNSSASPEPASYATFAMGGIGLLGLELKARKRSA